MSTLKEAGDEIFADLKKFEKLPRFIGVAIQSETYKRIFIQGIKSNGSRAGTYAAKTISLKKENNHFTSNSVNFRNTEQLAGSYTFEPRKEEVILGFEAISRTDKTTNDKVIESLEEQYGDIFGLTSKEEELVQDLIEDFTDKIFD